MYGKGIILCIKVYQFLHIIESQKWIKKNIENTIEINGTNAEKIESEN